MKNKTIEDLKDIGFKYVGYWEYDTIKNKLKFNIINADDLERSHLLYAMECEGRVRYIGITETTLKKRFENYKSGHNEKSSGSTNKKVYKNINSILKNGGQVNIYILQEKAPFDFKGYEISLATGIEKSLIKAFDFNDQLWNKRGVENTDGKTKSSKEKNTNRFSKIENIINLLKLKENPICDDCITKELGITNRQTVNTECNTLYKKGIIYRSQVKEKCVFCNENKKVNSKL